MKARGIIRAGARVGARAGRDRCITTRAWGGVF